MLVYRLSKTEFAGDLEGTGAKLYGGRWNNKGTACVYTSVSRALAVLEFASNVELEFIPEDLSITTYELPEEQCLTLSTKELPKDWEELPSPQSTKDLGNKYFSDSSLLCLRVPSVVVPEEYNYLINPESDKIAAVKVIKISAFEFDSRIKR
ncbi:RES family NAD+ phosphorylase [Pedobacter panaciterrae]|uniref:RES family NAD+ phosphorylase n=1 Tax=Pedobacter panaciterrae TaxID=363849 RepID=UPI00155DBACA|nr:RES family NAD+ phosphorylase [Pedobacter panaciterrae]NQX54469.1 RES family NAD+ phosphorylase [Pedobacter panaciterrae]